MAKIIRNKKAILFSLGLGIFALLILSTALLIRHSVNYDSSNNLATIDRANNLFASTEHNIRTMFTGLVVFNESNNQNVVIPSSNLTVFFGELRKYKEFSTMNGLNSSVSINYDVNAPFVLSVVDNVTFLPIWINVTIDNSVILRRVSL